VSQVLSAKRDQNGILIGYDGILKDISRRKEEEVNLQQVNTALGRSLVTATSELAESREFTQLMAAAITGLVEGVMIVGREPDRGEYYVVFTNEALSRISGYPAHKLLGQSLSELCNNGLICDDEIPFEVRATGASPEQYLKPKNLRLRAAEGQYRDVEVMPSPIYDDTGELAHVAFIYRDATARKAAERVIRQRDEHLRAILNTVADAILTIDTNGAIKSANPVTTDYFGYSADDLLASNISRLIPSIISNPDSMKGPIPLIARSVSGGASSQYWEDTARRRDGSTMPVGISVKEIDASGLFTCVVRDLSLVKSLQGQILDVVEEENRRIGQELHDNIQQQLVGIRLLADNIRDTQEAVQTPSFAIKRLLDAMDHVMVDLRVLCRGMVSIRMDGDGLRAALTELTSNIEQNNALSCKFSSAGKLILVDPNIAGHLYRIAQESLTNALKYACATEIAVSLTSDAEAVTLEVCDNGIGIREEDLEQGGVGLQLMHYRAALIGANLTISRPDAGGTCLLCCIPSLSAALE
jgi:PAS domain S-box-containing protein